MLKNLLKCYTKSNVNFSYQIPIYKLFPQFYMSQIKKAKERILNRNKQTYEIQESYRFQEQLNQQHYFPKKFNISSISMKFEKEAFQHNSPEREKYSINLNIAPQISKLDKSHYNKQNPPYQMSLSQSSSQVSLVKNRRRTMQSQVNTYENPFDIQKKIIRANTGYLEESPISKIQKSVHSDPINLLIVRQQNRRCQSPYKPRQCIKTFAEQFVQIEKQKSNGFIDDQFPPKRSTVFTKKSLYLQEGLKFQRLTKIYQDKLLTLIKHCQPTSLIEGKFTNPFLFSALAILSQTPQKIVNIFGNQQANDNGIYYLNLCKDGVWRYIILDDFMPIKITNQNPKPEYLFCSTDSNNDLYEAWPALIQKGLAKMYGTYSDISMSRQFGITPFFKALTGLPVSRYDLVKGIKSYLVIIDNAIEKNQYVILQDLRAEYDQIAHNKNITADQSYRVLQVKKNYLVLRNIVDLELETKVFFDDAMMFSTLLIFRDQVNYNYISQKLRHKKGYYSDVKLTVNESTQCYLDIWQNNPAYYKSHLASKINYQVSPYRIILSAGVLDQSNFDSKPEQPQILTEKQSGKIISLKKGEYFLQIHLCQRQQLDFTLSYYGAKNVQIERIKNMNEWQQDCFCKK